MTTALTKVPDMGAIESVLIAGDLARLSADQRVSYYKAVCESVGLNPLTQPFEYLTLNNKLRLYARKDCTDQLRRIHGVSVVEASDTTVKDVHVVTVKVQDRNGRTDVAKGAVALGNLQGEALANAIMKAETKAKRRATLSICGLGMLDEVEVETIAGARPANGTYEPPADAGKGVMGFATPPEPDASTLPEEFTENVPCYDPKTGDTIKRAPGLTSAQNKHIHALLNKLGHHLDEPVRGKDGKQGTIIALGKYRKKLREVWGKEHTSELAIHEASWVIEWLLKCEAKFDRALERGTEHLPAPALITATSDDMGPLMELQSQLVANGHKSTDAQLAWLSQQLDDMGHPRVLSPSALTAGQLDALLARAQGEVR